MDNKFKLHILKTDNEFKTIFLSARNCFNNESIVTLRKSYDIGKAIVLTKSVINKEHLSILEHCNYQFILENVSRSFLAQFSRHRTGLSITVKSQHYINHNDYLYKELETDNIRAKQIYKKAMEFLNETYRVLNKDLKVPHYIAREVLPNATLCNIFVTVNLRELIHILRLRCGKENTPEIRYVCSEIFSTLQNLNPMLWRIIDAKFGINDKIERD